MAGKIAQVDLNENHSLKKPSSVPVQDSEGVNMKTNSDSEKTRIHKVASIFESQFQEEASHGERYESYLDKSPPTHCLRSSSRASMGRKPCKPVPRPKTAMGYREAERALERLNVCEREEFSGNHSSHTKADPSSLTNSSSPFDSRCGARRAAHASANSVFPTIASVANRITSNTSLQSPCPSSPLSLPQKTGLRLDRPRQGPVRQSSLPTRTTDEKLFRTRRGRQITSGGLRANIRETKVRDHRAGVTNKEEHDNQDEEAQAAMERLKNWRKKLNLETEKIRAERALRLNSS